MPRPTNKHLLCIVCKKRKRTNGSLFCRTCFKKSIAIKFKALSQLKDREGWMNLGDVNYGRLPDRR